MSHGGGGSDNAEPNLIPLLDMVLQLVMFFILVTNFTMEQVSEDIKLPDSYSAQPMDKSDADVLFLNVNEEGHVIVSGREFPLQSDDAIRFYLNDEVKRFQESSENKGEDGGVPMVAIIRGHAACDYAKIYNVLRLCKQAGFRKLQVRAIQKTDTTGYTVK